MFFIVVSVVGVVVSKRMYRPAKKWFVAGLLGILAVRVSAMILPMNHYVLGILILCCITLVVVGAELYRRNLK